MPLERHESQTTPYTATETFHGQLFPRDIITPQFLFPLSPRGPRRQIIETFIIVITIRDRKNSNSLRAYLPPNRNKRIPLPQSDSLPVNVPGALPSPGAQGARTLSRLYLHGARNSHRIIIEDRVRGSRARSPLDLSTRKVVAFVKHKC